MNFLFVRQNHMKRNKLSKGLVTNLACIVTVLGRMAKKEPVYLYLYYIYLFKRQLKQLTYVNITTTTGAHLHQASTVQKLFTGYKLTMDKALPLTAIKLLLELPMSARQHKQKMTTISASSVV